MGPCSVAMRHPRERKRKIESRGEYSFISGIKRAMEMQKYSINKFVQPVKQMTEVDSINVHLYFGLSACGVRGRGSRGTARSTDQHPATR